MDRYHLIAYLAISTVLIPLGLAVTQWKRIPRDISSLRWLLIASLVSDVVMVPMAVHSIPNLWVGDVYMLIQFFVLLYIFSLQFSGKVPFIIAGLIGTLFYLAGLFLENAIGELARSGAVDSLILIIVSIAFFYKLLNELKVVSIHRLPILWIAFATLFYYSGNLFVFLASGYLDLVSFMMTWTLHNILNVTKNILFAVALWQNYKIVRINHG